MSNATIRRVLERQPAPVIAFLIDNGWVHDDAGILNASYSNIREGLLVASRMVRGQVQVPVPAMGTKHPSFGATGKVRMPRERL